MCSHFRQSAFCLPFVYFLIDWVSGGGKCSYGFTLHSPILAHKSAQNWTKSKPRFVWRTGSTSPVLGRPQLKHVFFTPVISYFASLSYPILSKCFSDIEPALCILIQFCFFRQRQNVKFKSSASDEEWRADDTRSARARRQLIASHAVYRTFFLNANWCTHCQNLKFKNTLFRFNGP